MSTDAIKLVGMRFVRPFLSPSMIIVVSYFLLLLIVFSIYGVQFKFHHFKMWSWMLATLSLVYITTTIAHVISHHDRNFTSIVQLIVKKFVRFLADWFPLIALVTIYENLREYTGVINPGFIDAYLYKMDLIMFGVEPTLWIQNYAHPILTDYLSLTYSLFLFLPLSLGWVLYLKSRRTQFNTLSTAMMLCLCMGFLLYITFPAGPPRFYAGLTDEFAKYHLTGFFGYYDAIQTKLDDANPFKYRASFPSLHVAMSAIPMYYAIKFRKVLPFGRLLATLYLIFGSSLWFSTVYLRHHWVPDIVAGWAVAGIAIWCAHLIDKRWPFAEYRINYEYESKPLV